MAEPGVLMAVADRFALLVAFLALGSWGWGQAALWVLRRTGWTSARDVLTVPLQVLLGVSLFLVAGGFLVAAGVARFPVLMAWHVLGIAFLAAALVEVVRRSRGIRIAEVALAAAGSVVATAFFFITLFNTAQPGWYNPDDDDAAYIYLAKRLLRTGGLVDPFNQRRLTSYGGNTLYHALFLRVAGNTAVRGFEFAFAALVLLLAAIATVRRRWLLPGAAVVGIGLLLGHGTGPIVNLSPEFSVAGLSLGTYQLLRHVRPPRGGDQPHLYVVIGIFLAGILAFRFTFLLSVALAVVVVVVAVRGRRCARPLVVTALSMAACTVGWAVALLRSSGTPLFPVIAGNYNAAWPGGRDPSVRTLSQYAAVFRGGFRYGDVGMVALLALGTGLVFFYLSTQDARRMLVLAAAGAGCLVQLVAFSYLFSGSDPTDLARFEGPSTLACGLLAIDTFWLRRPSASTTATAGGTRRPRPSLVRRTLRRLDPTRIELSAGRFRALGAGAAKTAVVVAMSIFTFGYSFSSLRNWFDVSRSTIHAGYEVAVHSSRFVDRYASLRPDYHKLNMAVPRGAKVLAAVPYPALLDLDRYDVSTLDLAGGASPPPGMPFFAGTEAKVAYLRGLGYQYIAVASPVSSGLYQYYTWLHNYRSQVFAYRAWTPFFVDWQGTVDDLEGSGRFPVRYAGSLALVRIG